MKHRIASAITYFVLGFVTAFCVKVKVFEQILSEQTMNAWADGKRSCDK